MNLQNLIVLTFILVLSGCVRQWVDPDPMRFSHELSKAEVYDVEVEEVFDKAERTHKLVVTAKYRIEEFHDESGIYFCTILFGPIEGNTTITSWPGEYDGLPPPCLLNTASGEIEVVWSTPVDKDVYYSRNSLIDLTWPMIFDLNIHQLTGPNYQSTVIGFSDTFTLTKKI